MMYLLAEATQQATDAAQLFGMTVGEWVLLVGMLITFAGAVRENLKASKGEKKLEAVVKALEETKEAHPKAVALAKRLARDKATKLGVETGSWGLSEDVAKHTSRLSKRLGPNDPTPEPKE